MNICETAAPTGASIGARQPPQVSGFHGLHFLGLGGFGLGFFVHFTFPSAALQKVPSGQECCSHPVSVQVR